MFITRKNPCLLAMVLLQFIYVCRIGDASPIPFYEEYKRVEGITHDISTPEKRAKAIKELINIVKDESGDVNLRQFAAEKLGSLGAVEATAILKDLALKLEWTDSTRQLKRSVTLAYWQVKVVQEPTKQAQEQLLVKLLCPEKKTHEPPYADTVPSWAADELANRGVKEALPEISASIRFRNPTARGEEQINLCKTKIELLTSSRTRYEGLAKALVREDVTQFQSLKSWAVVELGKLNTQESRWTLIAYALELQKKYYDENGRLKPELRGWMNLQSHLYNQIITTLKKGLMTEDEIKAAGLHPDKFFVVTEG